MDAVRTRLLQYPTAYSRLLNGVDPKSLPRSCVIAALYALDGKASGSSIQSCNSKSGITGIPDLGVWLTVRSSSLRSHPGEVCLPGGQREDVDASDLEAGLREAYEECGLPKEGFEYLSTLSPTLTLRNLSSIVLPIVGLVAPDFQPKLQSPEVAFAFSVPLRSFLRPSFNDTEKNSEFIYAFTDVQLKLLTKTSIAYRVHRFHVPSTSFHKTVVGHSKETSHRSPIENGVSVWGMTAQILIQLAAFIYVDTPPNYPITPSSSEPSYAEIASTFIQHYLQDGKNKRDA